MDKKRGVFGKERDRGRLRKHKEVKAVKQDIDNERKEGRRRSCTRKRKEKWERGTK